MGLQTLGGGSTVPLSRSAAAVWAKSFREDPNGLVTHWLPLHQHLDDTRGVAELLVDEWLPRQVVDRIAGDLPNGRTGVRFLAGWLAAVHDVGKVSPAFAVQVPLLCDHMNRAGLHTHPLVGLSRERSSVRHELVGQVAVRQWLVGTRGFARAAAQALAVVVGSHHGVPPEESQINQVKESPDLAGTGTWGVVREELLDRAAAQSGGPGALDELAATALSLPSQVLLTGVVIMADWIASSDLFALRPVSELDEPPELDEHVLAALSTLRLNQAWTGLALPRPWRAVRLGSDLDAVLAARFGFPDAVARPVQRAAVRAAAEQTRPGMVIVEAPMGEGKTEAALLAAEELAARSGAGGCFIALPTQATSDAMFARALHWVRALPRDGDGGAASVFLAHGKAALNDDFQGLRAAGRYTSIGDADDRQEVVAHWWFAGRKKGLLANFVVGTIDQGLFGALKSKHLMLRHVALAGKVVIIDEAHAYDVYMSQYLDRLLQWLGDYGVPVVLLSATLPVGRRSELLAAYEGAVVDAPSLAYPVVSGTHGAGQRSVVASPRGVEVALEHLDDDLDALVALLRDRLREGGCAVVIRNTVSRVQETAQRLEDELGAEHVTVNHSRFLSCDRSRLDRGLLRRFGPDGAQRPALHVVVASQVVEQSLDVDFDLVVTDLAPTDLVLQRTGRLHRHVRTRPGPVSTPVCVLVGVEDWAADPVRALPGARRVYGEHVLLRSAALLGPAARQTISLPDDISPLVQAAYGGEELGPPEWFAAMAVAEEADRQRARKRRESAQGFLLGEPTRGTSMTGWVRAGVGDVKDEAQGSAQVRDGEEALEVVVVQTDGIGGITVADWIERHAGHQVPTFGPISSDLVRTLAACTLRLPLALCHPGVIDDVIRALESTRAVESFQQHPLLKGQLVLALDSHRSAVLRHGGAHFRLTYDPRRGLHHERL
jgi:CRISPR-associated endonuclease/helicase Cas3